MFRLRISASPSRCCVPSKPPVTPCPRRSRRAPSRRCCRAATCWASPRPAPARPPPSRCPSCSTSPLSASVRSPSSPRALVLAPTRELAVQIGRSFDTYGRGLGLRLGMVIGGLGYGRQIETLSARRRHPGRHAGPAARPGRARQRQARARDLPRPRRGRSHVRHGLHPRRAPHRRPRSPSSARRCCSRPPCRATSPSSPSEILKNPEKVEIAPQGRTVEKVDQRVYFVTCRRPSARCSAIC